MAAESQAESRKWRIESVGENFKVVFMHGDQAYELGLFSTREEGTRVADVLTIKEAVDMGQDLNTLKLEYPLNRYGVDNNTAHEIRSVSFNQVVRDLQCCCVEQLVPDGTVPGWTTELPSTALRQHSMHYRSVDEREYHDAVSQGEGLWAGPPSQGELPYGGGEGAGHEEGANAGAGQGQAAQQGQQEQQGGQGGPKGLPQLPPKPAGRGAGAKAPGAVGSAATNAFNAAGKANKEASMEEGGGGDMRPPPARLPLSQRGQQGPPSKGASVGVFGAPAGAGATAAADGQLATAGQDQGQQGQGQEGDALVLHLPPNLRPVRTAYRGITQTGRKWRCQTHIHGRNVGLVAGGTQMEAALVYDLLIIWKHLQAGEDPARGDYNYAYADIAQDTALMNMLRECHSPDMATNVLSTLVARGAVARVFGLQPEVPVHREKKAPVAVARSAAGGSGKKLHWRTRERLERERLERERLEGAGGAAGAAMAGAAAGEGFGAGVRGGVQLGPGPAVLAAAEAADQQQLLVQVQPPPGAEFGATPVMGGGAFPGGELPGSEGAGDEGTGSRPKKKLHWRTAAKLEKEREAAAAARGQAPGSASPGKKLQWKTAAKLERDRAAAAAAGAGGAGAGAGAAAAAAGGGSWGGFVGVLPNSRGIGYRAQVEMPANDLGQVVPGGQQLRAFDLPLTATQEESAVAHDLACLWRDVQANSPGGQYNYPAASYRASADLMAGLRSCPDLGALHSWVKSLQEDGSLARLAAQQAAVKAPAAAPAPKQQQQQQQQAAPLAGGQAVLSYRWDSHPFHGISPADALDPDSGHPLMFAQFNVKMDAAGKVDAHGEQRRVVQLAHCRTPAEAAAAFDIAHIWRLLQVGSDPASAEADPTPKYRYNFSYARYGNDAVLMRQIRSCRDTAELQELVKGLNRDGTLRQLAIALPPAADKGKRKAEGAAAAGAPPQKQARAAAAGRQQQQQQQQLEAGAAPAGSAGGAALVEAGIGEVYEPRETARVQAFESMCEDVKRWVGDAAEATRGALSRAQRVAFLAFYIRMRKAWHYTHQQIKSWHAAGQFEDIASFVLESLGEREALVQQQQQQQQQQRM